MTDLVVKTMKMHDDITIIGLEGILDNNTENEFGDAIKKIQDDGCHRFVFDLSRLNIITSSGIGAFIKIANSCRENYGNVVIVQPQPSVKEALQIFGLFNFIQLADNVNDAVKVLSSPHK
ncbi:MAG: STAS domain-containing protein [Planctomycetota bacterium]